MQPIHVPTLGPAYWVLISVASVFGANLGDFVSHDLHGGHWRGLVPLLLILLGILFAERRTERPTALFYWAAIITVRTAATNLADLFTHDFHLPYGWAVIGMALLLLAVVLAGNRTTAARDGLPTTGGWYWLGMLLAGTLGTATGDGTADEIGLGLVQGSLVLGAVTAVLFGLRARAATAVVATYWITVVAVRAAGTTLGDFCAHTLGLEWSTLISGLLLAALYIAFRTRPALNPAPASAQFQAD